MPTIIENDEGQDFYLSDDFKLVAGASINSIDINAYHDGFKWVFAVVNGDIKRAFGDKDILYVAAQVRDFFHDYKPEALREVLRLITLEHPQLLDKIYYVL